jgi:hypothetical protein
MPRSAAPKKGEYTFSLDKKPQDPISTFVQPELPEPNKATRLDMNGSDEELVYNSGYDFGMDIDTLLDESRTSRRAERIKRKGKGNPPRPQNLFMLYRRSITAKYRPLFDGKKSSFVSTIVGKLWKESESKEVKQLFEAAARIAEKRFMEKYPDYKYQPKAKGKRKEADSVQQKAETNDIPANNFQSNVNLETLIKLVDFLKNSALDPASSYPSPNSHSSSDFYPSPVSNTSSDVSSLQSSPIVDNQNVVGFDDELLYNDMFSPLDSINSITQSYTTTFPNDYTTTFPNGFQDYTTTTFLNEFQYNLTNTNDPVLYCNEDLHFEDFFNL